MRRVRDLAVERDDVAADVRQRRDRLAVRLARRDLLAELVRRQLAARRLERVRLAGLRLGHRHGQRCARRRAPRSPSSGVLQAACRACRAGPRPPSRPCPSWCARRSPSAGRWWSRPRRRRPRSRPRRGRRSRSPSSRTPRSGARSRRGPSRASSRASGPSRLTSMIAVRLSRPSQPACWNASHIEPSAISESPHSTHTRYGQLVERLARHRDADADRQALAERAGGDVGRRDPRRRVALEPRVELAERQQLLVVDRADRLQHRVVQRRRVALGEDQVVVGRVVRVRVVELQVAVDQHRHQVGGGHRRGRMAGAGRSRACGRSRPAAAARVRADRSRRHQLELGLEPLDQVRERLRELLDALALERLHDLVVRDAGGLEGIEDPARLLGVLEQRVAADLAVVERPPRRARAASC